MSYFLAEVSAAGLAAESTFLVVSAAALAAESAAGATVAVESFAASLLAPEPQAARAPIAKTNNSFFICCVFCVSEFPVNTGKR